MLRGVVDASGLSRFCYTLVIRIIAVPDWLPIGTTGSSGTLETKHGETQ